MAADPAGVRIAGAFRTVGKPYRYGHKLEVSVRAMFGVDQYLGERYAIQPGGRGFDSGHVSFQVARRGGR